MIYHVLVLPEGKSPITGRIHARWLLADLASRPNEKICVVRDLVERWPPVVDFSSIIGHVDNLVLRKGGLYGDLEFFKPMQDIIDGLLIKGAKIEPKLSISYVGMMDEARGKGWVGSIDYIVALKLRGLT